MKKILFLSILTIFLLNACSNRYASRRERKIPCLHRIVVIGFRPGKPVFKNSSYLRCIISGSTFRGEIVSKEVLDTMAEMLLKELSKKKGLEIIPPSVVEETFLDVYNVIDNTSKKGLLLEYLRQIGITFDADAVMIGHVFRWEERVGSDFAAAKPASVSFDLHLIDTENGKVVWTKEFNKTQQSLTENLLGIKIFVKGKGRWLTAKGLAGIGISEMIKELFKTQKDCK